MRTQILLLCLVSSLFRAVAQINPVQDYLKVSKDHAIIYNGEIEFTYTSTIYANLPYFQSADFVPGEILFKGNVYSDQPVRLDLSKDQLIIVTPQTNLCTIVDMERIQSVKLHNTLFIYNRPTADSKLEKGFYEQLYAGKHLTLLARKTYQCNKIPAEELARTRKPQTDFFIYRERYYLKYDGNYYPVGNKKSFYKIFPAEQKSISRYCKKQNLKFKKEKSESSLMSLTDYCETLINQNNNR